MLKLKLINNALKNSENLTKNEDVFQELINNLKDIDFLI